MFTCTRYLTSENFCPFIFIINIFNIIKLHGEQSSCIIHRSLDRKVEVCVSPPGKLYTGSCSRDYSFPPFLEINKHILYHQLYTSCYLCLLCFLLHFPHLCLVRALLHLHCHHLPCSLHLYTWGWDRHASGPVTVIRGTVTKH